MPDLSNWGQYGKLDDNVEYGRHIRLTCKNHPHLQWSTKNIAPIGARSIFFVSEGTECNCSASDLIVVPATTKE